MFGIGDVKRYEVPYIEAQRSGKREHQMKGYGRGTESK